MLKKYEGSNFYTVSLFFELVGNMSQAQAEEELSKLSVIAVPGFNFTGDVDVERFVEQCWECAVESQEAIKRMGWPPVSVKDATWLDAGGVGLCDVHKEVEDERT